MATNLGTNDDTCAIMKENIMLKEKLNKVSSKFIEFSGKLESLISEYKEYSEEQLLVDEKGTYALMSLYIYTLLDNTGT